MGEERRFDVTICLEVSEPKGKKDGKFFEAETMYHNLGYEGVVAIETVLLEMLGKLTRLGVAKVEAMGLADKLAVLLRQDKSCSVPP